MASIDEVEAGIYRIHTVIPPTQAPGGFSFNQYLILDEEPLLFHTGSRLLFPAVKEAIRKITDPASLRWIAFSHHEQDEDGALNEFLAAAPAALPVCSAINAMINADGMDRPPRILRDGEELRLGRHTVRWVDAPHVPHGWESGYLFEAATRTLLCGDLFTQPGIGEQPVTESDILGPSEDFRKAGLDYYSHGAHVEATLLRMAALRPQTLACMHGSAWRGDGDRLIQELARAVRE
jgi:flavorubredoxin